MAKQKMNNHKKDENPSSVTFESLLKELDGINQMFDSFVSAETEGMIICDNCYDNVWEDDENVRTAEDAEGNLKVFCCPECLKEWKARNKA